MTRVRQVGLGCGVGLLIGTVFCAGVAGPCWTAYIGDGVWLDSCPDGHVRPTARLFAENLGRGRKGIVQLDAIGHYYRYGPNETPIRRFSPSLFLVDAAGKETELDAVDGWESPWAGRQMGVVELPTVPDGDYLLRARLDTAAGPAEVDALLPLYQPAIVHVLTDSPLYKPGQTIQFRAVILGQGDMKPLDGRPGTWRVTDPTGEVLLEEKGKAGNFGVAASDFPLDGDAENGAWKVSFQSGSARDEVTVDVKPFRLPRFTVDATADAPFYRSGATPSVRVSVRYTSGAPVADAPVLVQVSPSGAWPPPNEWLSEQTLRADKDGVVTLKLPLVPADLRGQASLNYTFTATDATGERAGGSATVKLSEDLVSVDAVTEVPGGLVAAVNNRLYVRVTTPDGRPLPNTPITLKRAWDRGDKGIVAMSDADAVAKFQVDPGRPITVVEPALPVRRPPAEEVQPVALSSSSDALTGQSLDLGEQAAVDAILPALDRCREVLVDEGDGSVSVAALVRRDGGVSQVMEDGNASSALVARCVADAVRRLRAPSGEERLWLLSFDLPRPGLPWLSTNVNTVLGDPGDLDSALLDTRSLGRRCVLRETEDLDFPQIAVWRVAPGEKKISWTTVGNPESEGQVSVATSACVMRGLPASLPDVSESGGMGILAFTVNVPNAGGADTTASPVTWPGFDYLVIAGDVVAGDAPSGDGAVEGGSLGTTHLRLREGTVPNLRLRLSEIIVNPGDTVELTAIRGESFSGYFPKEMLLKQGDAELVKFTFDPEKRRGSFVVPKDASGFAHVAWSGATTTLYIRPAASLEVALTSNAATYRPGETAELTVKTTGANGPVAAGVTLSGVDSTLATMATLPGPDAFARVTVLAKSSSPAFGVLDAQALQTGQILGENAAQATVLRMDGLPPSPPKIESVSSNGSGVFEMDGILADNFYPLYAAARAEVRTWAKSAPAEETLTPKRALALWEKALSEHPAEDAFGRPLHLGNLPGDLLTLTDPRFMVADATRLPEDVENWAAFVARESP